MENKNLDNTEKSNNQVLISYELLCLLKWFITHDSTKLKRIVASALTAELKREMYELEAHKELPSLEETQHIIVEFFGMLELLLLDSLSEQAMQNAYERDLMPLIQHIDVRACDNSTIRSSVEKVTQNKTDHSAQYMQSLLLKELLKNWKPQKKEIN